MCDYAMVGLSDNGNSANKVNSFGANAPVEGRLKERLYVEARAVATKRRKTLAMRAKYSTNKRL